jgi:hypothetical protein
LEDKAEKCDTPDNPERNAGSRVPGISAATESDNDHEKDEDGAVEDGANPINFTELLEVGDFGFRIERRENEEIDRGEEASEGEVDVESLGLRDKCRLCRRRQRLKTYPAPGSTAH